MGRTVWRVADNLEKTLLRNYNFFVGNFFKFIHIYDGFHVKYNTEPSN